MDATRVCPCGSGRSYVACCGPLHAGGAGQTAEALMRSRFSAFALGDRDYLLRSWHPSTRPTELDLDGSIEWRRLQIVDVVAGGVGDDTGAVEFRASFRGPDGGGLLQERSRFARDPDDGGEWRYVDGEMSP